MSNIKNLKSGSVPPSDAGNSVVPDSAMKMKLQWGNVNMAPIIQKQANSQRASTIKKTG